MLNRFCTILTLIALCSCTTSRKSQTASSNNTLSSKEQSQGWELLFDGSTKNGWHVFNNRTDGAAWKVEDGVLFLDPKAKGPKGEGGGDLTSDKTYGNFHLKLDWKIDSAGNSGIMFHAQEDPKYRWAYVTAPEMQIIDNNAHADAKFVKHRAGDLYDLISAVPENSRKAGEWNTSEIIYQNGNLSLYQNGKEVVITNMNSPEFKELIAKSKFKTIEEFAKVNSGKLVLQDHGDKVWFRNIKVKTL
ncbi:DUF1080 domain-containing protein [Pseudoflavitalea sp. G-6-1-2]|uniref:3-keto-disaccharide hydrolase n=1 Tax=Pseudoflavitalea sp. G-6-1-2 TaxID=2728841 RepID=UPI00146B945C|nr:DUF1080 domain-containing protein [Pseudoflavitalea sp. G-6-1-2]NML19915.1 DUF1080 domain-containing protein [Pseudoflavitalea sp. G-6-1-2]